MVSPPPPRRADAGAAADGRPAFFSRLRHFFFSLRLELRVFRRRRLRLKKAEVERKEEEERERERGDDDGLELPPDAKFEHAAAAVALGALGGPRTPRISHGAPGVGVEGSAAEPSAAGTS